jgi:YgiT-type zinc finger domain-containing protein
VGQDAQEAEKTMRCHICGGAMNSITTDLPFKVSQTSIVILKELPVLQCSNCREFALEDQVMERVDVILSKTDTSTELQIVKYAA